MVSGFDKTEDIRFVFYVDVYNPAYTISYRQEVATQISTRNIKSCQNNRNKTTISIITGLST